jgi:hypothetical protein
MRSEEGKQNRTQVAYVLQSVVFLGPEPGGFDILHYKTIIHQHLRSLPKCMELIAGCNDISEHRSHALHVLELIE